MISLPILKPILNIILKKEVYGTVLIIFGAFIFYKIAKKLIFKLITAGNTPLEKKRRRTITDLFLNIIKYLIFIITCLMILELYGVDTKSLIAGLGILGAVLGLALQDTLKDIISGITIILENYYIVGDYVNYNGFIGEIINFGFKSTRIKNVSGEVLIVANRNITEIVNISQKSANVIIDIPAAYEAKIENVEAAIGEIIAEIKTIPNVYGDLVEYQGIDNLDTDKIDYRLKITCEQEHQWDIKRKSLRIIKKVFDKRKIKIPYPQLEVHNAKDN